MEPSEPETVSQTDMSECGMSQHGVAQTEQTRIAIRYGESSFEIEGPEDVVERTLKRYLGAIGKLFEGDGSDGNGKAPLGLVRTADVDTGPATPAAPPPLKAWYEERLVHPEGRRGIVQDHVLLFVYFATEVRGQGAASTGDIRRSFEKMDMKIPNVPVMVYNLKAKGSLTPASEYASYVLTPAGKAYIEDRFGILRRR